MRIYVAAHKPYRFPDDPLYAPIQAGAALSDPLGLLRDDAGENISAKNRTFCELTVLYWLRHNSDEDVIGLAHYRRHFAARRGPGDPWARILTGAQLEAQLARADILLPKKRHYVVETNASQYAHAHHASDLAAAREAILRLCPAYAPAFDAVMRRRSGHRFNMLIMKRAYFDAYCDWLFPLLFDLEARLDLSGYDAYNLRVFGFIGERLLDVWLEHNGYAYAELPVMDMEPVNWPRKALRFLARKLRAQWPHPSA